MHKRYSEIVFNNLDEFYHYVEDDVDLLRDPHLSQRLRSLGERTENEKTKKLCLFESYVFDFFFKDSMIKSRLTMVDESKYPGFELFDDDLLYVKDRAENEKNPKYRAHYNHLLWRSPIKNLKYAKEAVLNYLLFLNSHQPSSEENLSNHEFGIYYGNLFSLAQEINYSIDNVIELLYKFIKIDEFSGYTKYSMIQHTILNAKKLDKQNLKLLFDYVDKVIDEKLYPEFENEYLHLQVLICPKLKISTKSYYEKLAEMNLVNAKKNESSFIVHDYYLRALNHFKKAGNKAKIEEVAVMMESAKGSIDLKSVSLGGDDKLDEMYQKCMKVYDEFTTKLVESTIEDIFTFLTLHDIFPKADQLDKGIESTMMSLVSTMTFDINANVSKSKKGIGLSHYHLHVQNFSINIIWMVFKKGISNGKINFKSSIDYLKSNSWYESNSKPTVSGSITNQFNWIELISPSLHNFFEQIRIDIENGETQNTGYILATDSVVLKFEGIIRDISRKIGAQTIEIAEDGTKERISFEGLLENEKFKELIPPDDIALLKYLFTSKGINLRNNVAHCFFNTMNYGPGTFMLMIVALLRLGNFEFSIKTDTQ